MNGKSLICPKCGCEYCEVVVPALLSEDEVYRCPCCEIIFDIFKILVEQEGS
jgi:hypothetical protein